MLNDRAGQAFDGGGDRGKGEPACVPDRQLVELGNGDEAVSAVADVEACKVELVEVHVDVSLEEAARLDLVTLW